VTDKPNPSWYVDRPTLVLVAYPGEARARPHRVGGWYCRTFWLPVLGPTALLALERLADAVGPRMNAEVHLDWLGRELGVGGVDSRNSTIIRAMCRLEQFEMVVPKSALAVRTTVPTLTAKALAGLPIHLRVAHLHAVPVPAAR